MDTLTCVAHADRMVSADHPSTRGKPRNPGIGALIDVERDPYGRLVGDVDWPGSGRRDFTGILELARLLEQGIDIERSHHGVPH